MKFLISIQTFNRPKLLANLLKDILMQFKSFDYKVLIYDDFSSEDYGIVKDFVNKNNEFSYKVFDKNYGKFEYWAATNIRFKDIEKESFDFCIFMPDDIRLCKNFAKRAVTSWRSIKSKKIALNLCKDSLRTENGKPKPCWTNFTVYRESKFAWNVGWVDMLFLCNKDFFKKIKYNIDPISKKRWSSDSNLSSGVGMQISRKLYPYGLYLTDRSLVVHVDVESKMNKLERVMNPIYSENYIDGEKKMKELKDEF